jgi:hypothetical protein
MNLEKKGKEEKERTNKNKEMLLGNNFEQGRKERKGGRKRGRETNSKDG